MGDASGRTDLAAVRWLFRGAAVYGLLLLLPLYFMESRIGADFPPAITHPEFFYGFIGLATSFQFVFLIIGHDPVRYRWLILPGILEKIGYGVPVVILVSIGRAHPLTLLGGGIDLLLAAAFGWAFLVLHRKDVVRLI